MRVLAILMLLAAGAGGAYLYVHGLPESGGQASRPLASAGGPAGGFALPVVAAEVQSRALVERLRTIGTLVAGESIAAAPEIAGRLNRVPAEEGQQVARGTVLFELDATVYQAELVQAEAALVLSRANYTRTDELLQRNAGTVRARDEAVAQLRRDEATLSLVQARLEKARVLAPFDGLLGLRMVSPGAYVVPGQTIIQLDAIDTLKIDFRIPEVRFPKLQVGQTLEIEVDAQPGRVFDGIVYAVDSEIDVNGRSVLVRGLVPNRDAMLRPGMFARVALVVDTDPDALMVPEAAIVPVGGDVFVFRVEDGKASRVPVRIGIREFGEVQILEGVSAGDMIVTDGQIKLRDGAAVTVLPPDAGSPPASISGDGIPEARGPATGRDPAGGSSAGGVRG